MGRLIGFFVSEIGPLNQVVHLWGFDSLAERERRRAEMEQDPGWTLYRDALKALDVILEQDTRLLKSVPFSPVFLGRVWAAPLRTVSPSSVWPQRL